jgi:putative ABC transport system permease protein
LEQIRGTPGVSNAAYATWFGGIYQDPKNFFGQFAIDPVDYLSLFPEYIVSEEHRTAFENTRVGALVGIKLMERFEWEVGDRVPIRPTFWRPRDDGPEVYEFEIVGTYSGAAPNVDETQFFFHYDYLKERTGDIGQIGWYSVGIENPEQADQVALAIDRMFANSPAETKTSTEKAFMQGFAKQIGDTGAILSAIVSIVFFVILLIVGNTMAQSVRERISELGVLKTLGFTDGAVLALVLGESLLLAVLGGLIGLVLFLFFVPGLRPMVENFLPVFYLPGWGIALGIAFAVLLGLASGLIPAWTAMRLQIVQALRRV